MTSTSSPTGTTPTPSRPTIPDLSLCDGRRLEELPPEERTTCPSRSSGLDLLFLGGAVAALLAGLHLLAPAPHLLHRALTGPNPAPAAQAQVAEAR